MVKYILTLDQVRNTKFTNIEHKFLDALKAADHDYNVWMTHRQPRGLSFEIREHTLMKFENAMTVELDNISATRYFNIKENWGQKINDYFILTSEELNYENYKDVFEKYGYKEYRKYKMMADEIDRVVRVERNRFDSYDQKIVWKSMIGHWKERDLFPEDINDSVYMMTDMQLNSLVDKTLATMLIENPNTFTWNELFSKFKVESVEYKAWKIFDYHTFHDRVFEYLTGLDKKLRLIFQNEIVYGKKSFYEYIILTTDHRFESDHKFDKEEIIEFLHEKYEYCNSLVKSANKL